jgi:leader peptidase (prepilin peptidase)/N-methyltransferase
VGSAVFWWTLAAALGPLCGFLVARASLQLAADKGAAPAPSLRRYGLGIGACLLACLWAMSLSTGAIGLIGGLLGCQLVLIAMLDAEHFWLPHRLTLPLGLMGLAQAAAFQPDQLIDRLAGAVIGFAALAAIAWAYRRTRGREGMGGGDFRLMGAAGAWVGWVGLPGVLVLGSLTGLMVVGVRALRGKAISASEEAPFGVYLAIGLWLTWLYGPLGLAR